MNEIRVALERLPHAADLPLPAYATPGSAGADLLAAIHIDHPIVLTPGARALVATGIKLAVPLGYEAQIRPRSGLALRYGVTVLNAPGTIDSDYSGEVGVVLVNLGSEPFQVVRASRVAQLVLAPVTLAVWDEREVAASTVRGGGGFGSTGFA